MKKGSKFISIILSLLSLSLAGADHLDELCASIEGWSYIPRAGCKAVLLKNPRSLNANNTELAVISIGILIADAENVRVRFQVLSAGEQNSTTKGLLESCVKFYNDKIPILSSAEEAAASGHYGDAEAKSFEFRDAPWSCDDGFKAKGIENPASEENTGIFLPIQLAGALNSLAGGGN